MSFADVTQEDRRLTLLKALESSAAYSAGQFLLGRYCEQFGHQVSNDRLRTDLTWLQEQGLISLVKPEGVFVATLTESGLDVARGRTIVPGVARPQPEA